MALTFHSDQLDQADVQALLALHFDQMRAISPPEACHVLPADGLRDPDVTLWSVREHGALVGIGALKSLGPDHGEIKSMRVAPAALGRGAGRAILHHLVAQARARGCRKLSLETGNSDEFIPALRLYQSEGFAACGPFGGYAPTPFTCFLARTL